MLSVIGHCDFKEICYLQIFLTVMLGSELSLSIIIICCYSLRHIDLFQYDEYFVQKKGKIYFWSYNYQNCIATSGFKS